eukprot:486773-Pyramimonas_sp.AAC.1
MDLTVRPSSNAGRRKRTRSIACAASGMLAYPFVEEGAMGVFLSHPLGSGWSSPLSPIWPS